MRSWIFASTLKIHDYIIIFNDNGKIIRDYIKLRWA